MNINPSTENEYDAIPTYSECPYSTTVLYRLEPIGIGTPYVESLSSYVTRLAAAHVVPVSALTKHIIYPQMNMTRTDLGKTAVGGKRASKFVNGLSGVSSDWVTTMETLTGRSGLKFLTMLPFANLLSGEGITSELYSWCPICLEEWREQEKIVYSQLLWCISESLSCTLHRSRLQTRCTSCNYSIPILAGQMFHGYCPKCNFWLGSHNVKIDDTEIPEGDKFLVRVLENASELQNHNSTFVSLLNYLIGKRMKVKSTSAMSQLLGINIHTINSLISGKSLPTISNILEISNTFKLDPLDVITKSGEEIRSRDEKHLIEPSVNKKHNLLFTDSANRNSNPSLTRYIDSLLHDLSEEEIVPNKKQLLKWLESKDQWLINLILNRYYANKQ